MKKIVEIKDSYIELFQNYEKQLESTREYLSNEKANYLIQSEEKIKIVLNKISIQSSFWFKVISIFIKPKISVQDYIEHHLEPNVSTIQKLSSEYFYIKRKFHRINHNAQSLIKEIDDAIIDGEYDERFELSKIRVNVKHIMKMAEMEKLNYRKLEQSTDDIVIKCQNLIGK